MIDEIKEREVTQSDDSGLQFSVQVLKTDLCKDSKAICPRSSFSLKTRENMHRQRKKASFQKSGNSGCKHEHIVCGVF